MRLWWISAKNADTDRIDPPIGRSKFSSESLCFFLQWSVKEDRSSTENEWELEVQESENTRMKSLSQITGWKLTRKWYCWTVLTDYPRLVTKNLKANQLGCVAFLLPHSLTQWHQEGRAAQFPGPVRWRKWEQEDTFKGDMRMEHGLYAKRGENEKGWENQKAVTPTKLPSGKVNRRSRNNVTDCRWWCWKIVLFQKSGLKLTYNGINDRRCEMNEQKINRWRVIFMNPEGICQHWQSCWQRGDDCMLGDKASDGCRREITECSNQGKGNGVKWTPTDPDIN